MMKQEIVVKEIPGDLEDFLEFMEVKSDLPEYRDKLQVEPDFKFNKNKLGPKLVGVILTGAGVVVPLIRHWIESRKNKTKKREDENKFFINICGYDDEGNELFNESKNMTLEQLGKFFENTVPNRRLEFGLKIQRINFRGPQEQMNSVKKILIISANPTTAPRLRLDKEFREIQEGLLRSRYGGRFEIQARLAVRFRDLRRALLDCEPHIVHFTGHGTENGLMVEDEQGAAERTSSKALSELFELFSTHVECVVLNACYSVRQADAIKKHINYVVGMKKEINDNAAIEFAVGFYDALGAGKSVEDAFQFGCNAVLQKFPDLSQHLIPILKKRK